MRLIKLSCLSVMWVLMLLLEHMSKEEEVTPSSSSLWERSGVTKAPV